MHDRREFLATLAALAAAPSTPAAQDGAVATVTGDVPVRDLGMVLMHEHVMVDFIGADKVSRSRYDADDVVRVALPHLREARELGCRTIVECTPAFLGRNAALLYYGLMALVSVTAVGAFSAVGSILVVALMIAPPATAYLLTDSLARMLGIAAAVGAASAIGGYWLAYLLDASIAGCMATVAGALFGLAWLLAPGRGLVSAWRRRARQRVGFAQTMLAIHLANHEGRPEAAVESRVAHLGEHLRWEPDFATRVVRGAERRGLVVAADGSLSLTERGRELAREAVVG